MLTRQLLFIGKDFGGAKVIKFDRVSAAIAERILAADGYHAALAAQPSMEDWIVPPAAVRDLMAPFLNLPPTLGKKRNFAIWASKVLHFARLDAFPVLDSAARTALGLPAAITLPNYVDRYRPTFLAALDALHAAGDVDPSSPTPATPVRQDPLPVRAGTEEPRQLPMRCTPRPNRCRPTAAPANGLRAIVDDYIRRFRRHARAEMRFYAGQPTLADAVRVAAGCVRADGKRHPHQYRIPAASLQKAVRRLQRVDLAAAETFDELHELIADAIADVYMLGPLTVYDIAHRLGAFLDREPTRVYLHRGTRDGARALDLGRGRLALDLDELPREFHRLTAAEAEDCLCIYKAQIALADGRRRT